MTKRQARLFADYILGMPDRNGAADYVRFSAFRLDDTFFNELREMISEARQGTDGPREQSLEWLSSVASDAKGRAYAPFRVAGQRSQARATSEPQTGYSRGMQVIELDKRVTDMMMRTHFNPADDAVIADWKNIVDGYRELVDADPPQTAFYTVESLRLKIARSLESLASAYESMDDRAQSRNYYQQAASAYEQAGQPNEAARCWSRLGEERMVEEARYNDQIRAALEDLERLDENEPEYYSRLVDLGEFQAHAGDNFAAEKTLLKAESGLEDKWPNPAGADLASALMATLQGMQAGKSVPPRQNIQISLHVRGLYRRINMQLAEIYRHLGDLTRAEDRLNRVREMDRSSPDDEFSNTMRNKLSGEWNDLFR